MPDRTHIEWTDATWNPIRGCTRVSQGCVRCFAEIIAARFSGPGQPYEGLAQFVERPDGRHEARWTGEVRLISTALTQPLRWRRPRRIFVNSMSDLSHEKVPDEWLDRIFAVMALCPQHTFQVLTKRPERMRAYVTPARAHPVGLAGLEQTLQSMAADPRSKVGAGVILQGDIVHLKVWPLPNVWLGVSVEDQATADVRIPILLDTPAAVRWISAEPLLGPIDLTRIEDTAFSDGSRIWIDALRGIEIATTPGDDVVDNITGIGGEYRPMGNRQLDWVVAGGESGSGARPMHPAWARSLRDQCAQAAGSAEGTTGARENRGVPFLFKQWGEWAPAHDVMPVPLHRQAWLAVDGHRLSADDVERDDRAGGNAQVVLMGDVGKHRAGRVLDGVLHDDYPSLPLLRPAGGDVGRDGRKAARVGEEP